jgi:hypothetical protein
MSSTTAQKESMMPLNFLTTAFLSLSIAFRAAAIAIVAGSVTGELYNVLACISVLMIIIINWPKFKERVKKIIKKLPRKKVF